MTSATQSLGPLDPACREFYCRSIAALDRSGVPFLIGGAYAFAYYTGIERHTKDFDVFVRPEDAERVLEVLAGDGCQTELTFPHWLGKAYCGDNFVDVIFCSGNGVARVDDAWFEHAVDGEILDMPVKLCPAEEIIWTKAFVMELERYDGADINHLIRARAGDLDWSRLLDRFGDHWRVLLGHLVMFGFVYPTERARIPERVTRELLGRLERELSSPPPEDRVCYGTIISREQYLVDVERWGYRDARLTPASIMGPEDVERWTAAIGEES